jgi:hypothetical protein
MAMLVLSKPEGKRKTSKKKEILARKKKREGGGRTTLQTRECNQECAERQNSSLFFLPHREASEACP